MQGCVKGQTNILPGYIPSVPGVAAFPVAWKIWSKRKHPLMQQFWPAVEKLDRYLDLQLPDKNDWMGETPEAWLARVDWEVFRDDFWEEQLRAARTASEPAWEDLTRAGATASPGSAARKNSVRHRPTTPFWPVTVTA
jgi:hypothetical protein